MYDQTRRMDVNHLPHHGTLTFDYVSSNVFHRMVDMAAASDADFELLLHEMHHAESMVLLPGEPKTAEPEPEPEPEAEKEAEPEPEPEKEELADIPVSWELRANALRERYSTLTQVHLMLTAC